MPASNDGTVFLVHPRHDLDLVFSLQSERAMNRDNTAQFQKFNPADRADRLAGTLFECRVTVHQHLDRD